MNLAIILAGMVGFTGIFHFMDSIAKARARSRDTAESEIKVRSDWYCTFRMSDLLGKDWQGEPPQKSTRKSVKASRPEKSRRQARRPRMYVS